MGNELTRLRQARKQAHSILSDAHQARKQLQIDPPLVCATTRGSFAFAKKTLRDDPGCLNAADAEGNTALHHAVFLKRDDIFKLLMEHKANFRLFNQEGYTAIHLAALLGTPAMLSAFHAAGADFTQTTDDHSNCLMLAVLGHQYDCLQALCKWGVPVDDTNGEEGITALFIAADQDDASATRILLAHHASLTRKNQLGKAVIETVMYKKNSRSLPVMLQAMPAGTLFGQEKNTALHLLIGTENSVLIPWMISAGFDVNAVNAKGETPLDSAEFQEDQLAIAVLRPASASLRRAGL